MIIINGRKFSGSNVTVAGGKIIIDGKEQNASDYEEKIINIVIDADVNEVSSDCGNITVNGTVNKNVKTVNGSIDISGDVGGDVKTTNGDVQCLNISGDVDTVNGNIKYKK